MSTSEFLKKWHLAVDAREATQFSDLIAGDAKISSPAYWSPKGPKSYVMTILTAVTENFEDFHYTKEWVDGSDILLEFTARVEETNLRGIDRITLNDDGLLVHLEVMIRPINALIALAGKVQGAFDDEHQIDPEQEGRIT